jgi:hypothetical protein
VARLVDNAHESASCIFIFQTPSASRRRSGANTRIFLTTRTGWLVKPGGVGGTARDGTAPFLRPGIDVQLICSESRRTLQSNGHSFEQNYSRAAKMPGDRPDLQDLVENPSEVLDVELKDWMDVANDRVARAKIARHLAALANRRSGFACSTKGPMKG